MRITRYLAPILFAASAAAFAGGNGAPSGEHYNLNILGPADDEIVCSTQNVVLARSNGKSSFVNVTTALTTISVDLNGDGVLETVSLFDPALQDYFWNYDNNGLHLAQLRFYPF